MNFKPGTFIYGIHTNPDLAFYGGERTIALVIHPEEHGDMRCIILQSAYQQMSMQWKLETRQVNTSDGIEGTEHFKGKAGVFSEKFQALVREYVACPTQELSDKLEREHYTLMQYLFGNYETMKVAELTLSPKGFKECRINQESILRDTSEYYPTLFEEGMDESYLQYASPLTSFSEFAKRFLPHTELKSLPPNSTPFDADTKMELKDLLDLIPKVGEIPYEEKDSSIDSIKDVWTRSFKQVRNDICSAIKDEKQEAVGFNLYTEDSSDQGLHSILIQELVNKGFYVTTSRSMPDPYSGYGSIRVELYPETKGLSTH